MKVALSIGCLAILFASCQKNLSVKEDAKSLTVSADALLPLPCHSTSFVSEYPIVVGMVPPFTFTKTLYSDTRVNSIKMHSRKNPIHQWFNRESLELSGQFSYGPNRAYLKGTTKTWLYYNFGNGVMKKLMSTKPVDLLFLFNDQGYCTSVQDQTIVPGSYSQVLYISYSYFDPQRVDQVKIIPNPLDQAENINYWPVYDQYGNVLTYDATFNYRVPNLTYTYDYTKPRGTKNFSYIPSQNWFSQEYSLLEVMQWLPQSKHQRKSVAATFWLPNTNDKIVQSQVYKNYQFDAKGNMTSVTYGDNIPQRTTWYCK
jgi:hypothetical protein